jgi:hypothetical protein
MDSKIKTAIFGNRVILFGIILILIVCKVVQVKRKIVLDLMLMLRNNLTFLRLVEISDNFALFFLLLLN